MSEPGSVIVAGVGPGLGLALSRRFASEGYGVLMLARNAEKLETFAREDPDRMAAHGVDLTDAAAVEQTVGLAETRFGPLACAIFNAGVYRPGGILDIAPDDFEQCWRTGAFAGFLFAQAAARRMVERGHGAILFTGATASLRGGAGFANLASPKFALRGLAQSLARELDPRGVHVAHIILDGVIRNERSEPMLAERGPDSLLEPDAIAEAYWQVYRQPRAAWTHELDLRPWSERF